MKPARACLAVALGLWAASVALWTTLSAQQPSIDAAFERFWAARSPADAAKIVDEIVRSGVAFDEAYRRLRAGRTYAAQPRNLVELTHETANGAYPFAANIPEAYDPNRKSPAVLFLHGGVGREQASVQASLSQASAFAEALPDHIFIVPQAWREAQWWSERQLVNVNGILDTLKRRYNIDENRVSLLGLSDGGTGAYYLAMRDGSPFASFVPMLGMALVLANDRMGIEGAMFPNNLRNKPFFVVNGGRDFQYPIDRVDMYVERFKAGGVDIDYRPQPDAGHDRTWWPQMKAPVEAFLRDRPRNPLSDRLTWQTSTASDHNRASWLVIDALGRAASESTTLDDVNLLHGEPALDFGVRAIGARIAFIIKGSNAEQIGLQPFDWLLELNGSAVKVTTDLDLLFAQIKPGTEIEMLVARRELPVEIKGVYAPKLMTPPPTEMFPRDGSSGRVDLVRSGNSIEATTSGVTGFTLLLSPDQFDFNQPMKVVANGRMAFEGRVEKSLATLVKWAAADNDRTVLFGAELRIDLTK
jgi:predicted esterase